MGYGIPDHLYDAPREYAPDELTFMATIAARTDVPPDMLLRAREGLCQGLMRTRIWLSDENQIEGFRRIAYVGLGGQKGQDAILAGVSQSGAAGLWSISDDIRKPIGDALEDALSGRTRLEFADFPFDINHFSREGQILGRALLEERMDCIRNALLEEDHDMPSAPHFMAMLTGTLATRAGRNGGGIRKAVKNALDPDVHRIAWGARATDIRNLTWLSGTSFADNEILPPHLLENENAGVALRRQRRCQATSLYPSMMKVMQRKGVTWQIDAGLPLKPVLADIIGIPESRLDLLRGKGVRAIGSPSVKDLGLLKHVSPDTAPGTGPKWHDLWMAHNTLKSMAFPSGVEVPATGSSGDDPDDPHRAIETRIVDMAIRESRDPRRFSVKYPDIASRNVMDAINDIRKRLVLPGMVIASGVSEASARACNTKTRSEMAIDFVLGMGLKDLEAMSKRWHRNIHSIEDRLGSAASLARSKPWAPLVGRLDCGDIAAREIASAIDLKRQGRSENNCVGGYAGTIRKAGMANTFSLIFSLEGEDECHATTEIEVICKRDTFDAHIRQNLARENKAPSHEADVAANDLLRWIRDLDISEIEKYRASMCDTVSAESREEKAPLLEAESESDVTRPGYLSEAWEMLSVYLPRKMRKAGPDALFERYAESVRGPDSTTDALTMDPWETDIPF